MNAISVPIHVKGKEPASWSIVLSILLILAGILAIAMPWWQAIFVNILLGWLLVFCGATHLVYAVQTRHNRGFIWQAILGIAYAAIGTYVLVNPLFGLVSMALALTIYLLVEGVLELVLSFQLGAVPGSGWLRIDGIITLILAAMIWRLWPSGAELVIATILGVSMIFSGLSRLMLSLAARRLTVGLT